jgi:hypothetical protein
LAVAAVSQLPLPLQRTVIDGIAMSYTGLILPLGVLASVVAWNLARYKGLNEQRWAVICLFFFPAFLALFFVRGHQRPGDTAAFRER